MTCHWFCLSLNSAVITTRDIIMPVPAKDKSLLPSTTTHRDPFGGRRRRGRHGNLWGSCRWALGSVPHNWHSRHKFRCTDLRTLRFCRPESFRTRCGPSNRCGGSRWVDCPGSRVGTSTRDVLPPSPGNVLPFRMDCENIPGLGRTFKELIRTIGM